MKQSVFDSCVCPDCNNILNECDCVIMDEKPEPLKFADGSEVHGLPREEYAND